MPNSPRVFVSYAYDDDQDHAWVKQLASRLRKDGVVFAEQDYLSPEGLVALGAMLGLEVALDG